VSDKAFARVLERSLVTWSERRYGLKSWAAYVRAMSQPDAPQKESFRRPVTVSLLHGTFAKGSTWPVIEAELRKQLAGRDLTITYPPWSGTNTVKGRLDGATRLAGHITAQAHEKRAADHFIVAHSHGGNVALLALRDPEVRAAVRGVVCLSTPFLVCRPRTFPSNGREVHEAAAAMGGMMFLFYLVWRATGGALTVYGTAAITTVLSLCAMPLFRRWHERALAFLERVRPGPPGTPILVIRSQADEASLLLTTLQAVNVLVAALWTFLSAGYVRILFRWLARLASGSNPHRRVATLAMNTLAVWVLCGLAYFVFIAATRGANAFKASLPEQILVAPGLALLASNALYFIGLALFAPAVGVTALLLLFFGPDYSVYAPFIELSVEQSPDVPSQHVGLAWSQDGSVPVDDDGLQHSRTHDDPRAATLAADWIRQRADSPD